MQFLTSIRLDENGKWCLVYTLNRVDNNILWGDHSANILNLCCYRILQSPRLFPPVFPFLNTFWNSNSTFLYQKHCQPLLSSWKAPSIWGFNPVKDGYRKSTGLFLGLTWAWEEWRVKEAGFENASSQTLNPLPTIIQLHLIALFFSGCFLCQISSGLSSGTRNQDASGSGTRNQDAPAASAARGLTNFFPSSWHTAAAGGLWRLKGFCIVCFQSCAFSLECCFCSAGWVGVGVWMLLFAVF